MGSLFSGPFFNYVMSQEPLLTAEYFAHGSSAMLFQRDGKLYRLTTDGKGHNFLARESEKGNPSVVRMIEDFGPVAPNDECADEEQYWLAEVEWLHPVDPSSGQGARLQALLDSLCEDGQVQPDEREHFIRLCEEAIEPHSEFGALLRTIIEASNFLWAGDGLVDANITNVMLRPSTGELVWSDPIHDSLYFLTDEQAARIDQLRHAALP